MKDTKKKDMTNPSKLERILSRERSKIFFVLAFVVPTLAVYIYACVSPIFQSIYSSFFKWSGFSSMRYIGWDNYTKILKDTVFFKSIKNDILYVLGKEILIVPLALLFALSMTRLRFKKAEVGAYRFLLYLPNVLSVSIIGIVWAFILDPYNGILNGLLKIIGLEQLIPANGWLVEYTMPSIIFVSSWCGIGYFMIILISAINSVSGELYEAADIDGAGQWKQLFYITIPAIWEELRFVITNIVIGTIGNYTLAMLLANGGIDGSGMVMGLYVYQYGIDSNAPQVGYANAAAVLLMIISSTIILVINKVMNKEVD